MGDLLSAAAVEINLGDGLKLERDGSVKCGTKPAVEADVKARDDLPRGHPLYGSRAVRCVPSGMGDCVIVKGKLVPIEATKPIEEPKPIDEKPAEEVVRGR